MLCLLRLVNTPEAEDPNALEEGGMQALVKGTTVKTMKELSLLARIDRQQ
jgi:hypothetical protein